MSTGESLEVHIFVICVVKYVKVLGNEAHGLLYILHKSNYHYIYNKQFSGGGNIWKKLKYLLTHPYSAHYIS